MTVMSSHQAQATLRVTPEDLARACFLVSYPDTILGGPILVVMYCLLSSSFDTFHKESRLSLQSNYKPYGIIPLQSRGERGFNLACRKILRKLMST